MIGRSEMPEDFGSEVLHKVVTWRSVYRPELHCKDLGRTEARIHGQKEAGGKEYRESSGNLREEAR